MYSGRYTGSKPGKRSRRNSILTGIAGWVVSAFWLLSGSPCFGVEPAPGQDVFAAIAMECPAPSRGGVEEVKPAPLPRILLEAAKSDPSIPSPSYHIMNNYEEFRESLERLKQQYAPFLEDRTPRMESTRARMDLTTFQFRMEQPEDLQDFSRVLGGEGTWETVRIPHFRGPRDWWTGYYRQELEIPAAVWNYPCQMLHFGAVSDFCEVFLNGRYVGGHTGWWAPFEIDVTDFLQRNEKNVLVVKVRNEISWEYDRSGVKIFSCTSPGWDDPIDGWHESQSGNGIWQKSWLEGRPNIHITDIFVRPDLASQTIETRIKIYQHTLEDQKVKLTADIYPRNFEGRGIEPIAISDSQPVGPHYSEVITRLKFENYRLWDLDTPWLYTMQITLEPVTDATDPLTRAGRLTQVPLVPNTNTPHRDRWRADFGMRSFTMDETQTPKGTLYLNGREIILRGANHMGNLHRPIMEGRPEQIIEDILIAKLAHMNYWRLTQCPVQPEVYDLCDRLGILAQTDLPLFGSLQRESFSEGIKQVGEMVQLVRNHPCNNMITFINEPGVVGKARRHIFLSREELELFFAAASETARFYHPDQVIKPVDGDYDPPTFGLPDNHCYCLWYDSHAVPYGKLNKGYWVAIKPGWKFGCGEYGIEALDNPQTMLKYCPKEWMPGSLEEPWNPDKIAMSQTWSRHHSWFDTQDTMRSWVEASQNHQAFGIRQMTRAFRRQKDMSSSAVHLLIDAWPVGWMKTLVDVDRIPKKAYYEFRDALTPLLVDIRTDRTRYYSGNPLSVEFWVCNDRKAPFETGTLIWEVWQGKERLFAQSKPVPIPSYDPSFIGFFPYVCPDVTRRTPLTVRIALLDPSGQTVHASEQTTEVFPVPDPSPNQHRIAAVVGAEEGRGWKLAQSMGLQAQAFSADMKSPAIVFIEDLKSYESSEPGILSYVKNGGLAVILEQPNKAIWKIGEYPIEVKGIVGKEFVSRKTAHRFVKGFEPSDFGYWYSPGEDRIDYIAGSYLDGKDLQPILVTGAVDQKFPVAGELPFGKGAFVFCQLMLDDQRIAVNPIARQLFQNILDNPRP